MRPSLEWHTRRYHVSGVSLKFLIFSLYFLQSSTTSGLARFQLMRCPCTRWHGSEQSESKFDLSSSRSGRLLTGSMWWTSRLLPRPHAAQVGFSAKCSRRTRGHEPDRFDDPKSHPNIRSSVRQRPRSTKGTGEPVPWNCGSFPSHFCMALYLRSSGLRDFVITSFASASFWAAMSLALASPSA